MHLSGFQLRASMQERISLKTPKAVYCASERQYTSASEV